MKTLVNNVLLSLIKKEATWKIIKPFSRLGVHARFLHDRHVKENAFREAVNVDVLFSAKEVLNGVFKGMKYPSLSASGSAIFPKLLGTYEKELSAVIENICSKQYTEILDIGCAEGYYAVGLAMRVPSATVFAYDIDINAQTRCREMAKLNKVNQKINIRNACTASELAVFPFSGRGLIVCDCEGYELALFNKESLANLKGCDLLIETHDFIDIKISTTLHQLISETHDITIIKSVDDIEKVKQYSIPELKDYPLEVRKQLLGEYRPAIMEWFYCTAK